MTNGDKSGDERNREDQVPVNDPEEGDGGHHVDGDDSGREGRSQPAHAQGQAGPGSGLPPTTTQPDSETTKGAPPGPPPSASQPPFIPLLEPLNYFGPLTPREQGGSQNQIGIVANNNQQPPAGQGGSQMVTNQIFNSHSHEFSALGAHIGAQIANQLRGMMESFAQTSTPAPGSVRPRDRYPLPSLVNIPPPDLDQTRSGRPAGDRPACSAPIGDRLSAIAHGDQGSTGRQGPSSVGQAAAVHTVESDSQQGEQGSAVDRTMRQVNKFLQDTRAAHDEAVGLDKDLCATLGLPDSQILQKIHNDYCAEITRVRAMSAIRWYLRMSQAANVPTSSEVINLASELETIRQFLVREGRNGPGELGWKEFLRALHLIISKVEILRLRISSNEEQNKVAASSSQLGMGSLSTHPDVWLALKTIQQFDGKNPEEYVRYFDRVTGHLPCDLRITMLENSMGPKYLDRLKNIKYMTNWSSVMEELMKEFSSTPCSVTASLALNRLTQGTKDVRRYNDRVTRLLRLKDQVPENIKDTDMITRYLSGLSDSRVRKYLLNKLMNKDTRVEKTLHKFMEMARDDENRNKLVHSAPTEVSSDEDEDEVLVAAARKSKKIETVRAADDAANCPGFDPKALCQRHDQSTHTNGGCRLPAGLCPYCDEKDIPASKFIDGTHLRECKVRPCGNCGIRGHYARDCFRSTRKGGGRDRDRERSRDRDRSDRKHRDRRERRRHDSRDKRDRRRPRDSHRSNRSDKHKDRKNKYEKFDKKAKKERAFVAESASESSSTQSSGSDRSSSRSRSQSPA